MADSFIRASAGKVLLIGWDAADWKVISPLLDEGKMPNLEALVNSGVMGNIATLYPDLSPMLWTSIATGKRPFKHGVLGFIEPNPDLGGIRPITNLSRKTKAVWNILSQNGMKSNVIGWWPSHPAEPINGVMVSNRFQQAIGPIDKPWPLRHGTVHPRRLTKNIAQLRVHPQELTAGHIYPFVPGFSEIDQEKDHRLESLAKIISENLSVEAAALALMQHESWDFTAAYFDGIDHFCHGFMRYHPPHFNGVSESDFNLYCKVVESGYILHDIMLGRLMEQAGADTTIILVSDHGFQSGNLRPLSIPREPAGPAVMHRHYGIFAMRGPGIRKDERIYGAGILDICPTILCLFGLPVGLDMDGKPLVGAFEHKPSILTITSHDTVNGPAGMHGPDLQIDPVDADEAINQLVELGYIEKPSEDTEEAAKETIQELRYNLARSYTDANRHAEAIPILEQLFEDRPNEYRFGIQLVTSYLALDWLADARQLLELIFRRKEEEVNASRERLTQLAEEQKETKAEEPGEEQMSELMELRGKASANPFAINYLMGSLLFSEGNAEAALDSFRRAEALAPTSPSIHLKLGSVYLRMKRWEDAEISLNNALELDPDSAEAYRGLAFSHLRRQRNQDAAKAALDAVGRLYFDPLSHFILGVALHRLGEIPRAVEALKVAVLQNPNYPQAHRRLSSIYKNRLLDIENAAIHHALAEEAARRIAAIRSRNAAARPGKPAYVRNTGENRAGPDNHEMSAITPIAPADLAQTIVIVTGLPRSGTSMMMQMLSAGGISPLTDGKRAPDAMNPRGYLEFDPAKSLRRDNSWLALAKGRAVKIVPQLLHHISPDFKYRVVFMEREMEEILESQRRMLAMKSENKEKASGDQLGKTFAAQISAIKKMLGLRGIPTIFIQYGQTIATPREVSAKINGFLGGKLDEPAMAAAVEPTLRRVVRPSAPEVLN
jgi:predicted AlkP superfamily phosphohydrolase/phosphomutase/tetratricopeptide (TPR) repeat protein